MLLCEFEVPLVAPSANVLLRMHWAKRKRLLDDWRLTILSVCKLDDRNMLRNWSSPDDCSVAPWNVSITVCNSRVYDRDNLYASMKPVLDALVKERLIPGDSSKEIDLKVSWQKAKRGQGSTKISIST